MSPLGNSDHSVLGISCDWSEYSKISSAAKFNFTKRDYVGLNNAFNIDWDIFFDDCNNNIDHMWIKFRQFITQKTEEFIPKVIPFHQNKKNMEKATKLFCTSHY